MSSLTNSEVFRCLRYWSDCIEETGISKWALRYCGVEPVRQFLIVHFVLIYLPRVTLVLLFSINCFAVVMACCLVLCVLISRGEFFLYQLDKEGHPAVVERRKWDRRDFHYDNVASAMLTLFAVQTGEGWPLWVANLCSAAFTFLWLLQSVVILLRMKQCNMGK